MKKVKVLFVGICLFLFFVTVTNVEASTVCRVNSGDGTKVGDEITCGTESFYVAPSDEPNVKLFAKYNLEVGYTCDDSMNCISMTNPSGMQSKKCDKYTCLPSSNANKTYNESFQNAVSAYKNYLATRFGLTNAKVSVVDMQTLNSLGCKMELQTIIDGKQVVLDGSCTDSGKAWLYATSYNISIPDEDTTNKTPVPFLMKTTGKVGGTTVPLEHGVRVVVEIPKDDISFDSKEQENSATETPTNKEGSQTVEVKDTFKTAYIGYCIGTIILILGIMVVYQSYRKDKKEIQIKNK